MSMMNRLTTGQGDKIPPIGLIYGESGIGKTTMAAKFPGAIFLQTEEGLTDPALSNVQTFGLLTSYDDLVEALKAVTKHCEDQGWQTIVIDSIEGLDKLVKAKVLSNPKNVDKRGAQWQRIEDGAFGAGKSAVVAVYHELITLLIKIRRHANIGVLFLGQAKPRNVTPPDGDQHTLYGLTVYDDVEILLKANSDFFCFARREKQVVTDEGNFGRKLSKIVGVKDAVLKTSETGGWVAKNRQRMPGEIPMAWESLAQYFPCYQHLVDSQAA